MRPFWRKVAIRPVLLVIVMFCALALMPFVALIGVALSAFDGDLWSHLNKTVLWPTVRTTVLLLLGVATVTGIVGVATAWLVTACAFPARRVLSVLLLLPLALPTYVSAFAYVEFLGFSGPVQSTIRAALGVTSVRDYWFPDYRSLGGAIFVMSLVLYPYVYLTTRAAFMMQTASLFDACRTLGANPFSLFARVALPLARPAIVIGVALALMEAANDIGAVEFFGVKTLTTTVFDVWLNRSSLATAAQIACLFLALILLLLWLERHGRRAQKLYEKGGKSVPCERMKLSPAYAAFAVVACALPVLLGFVIPVWVLAQGAIPYALDGGLSDISKAVGNSLALSVLAMAATVMIGALLAYAVNQGMTRFAAPMIRLATLGYAIPGVILAVGVLIPLANIDNALDGAFRGLFGVSTGLLLSGSMFALVYAYTIRFLPMAYGSADAGFQRMSPNFGFAARTLGCSEASALRQVHLPLLRPALIAGALLVFVDCMKELPATLLLRPFNFNTLATSIYDAASLELFEEGALPALAIVLVGLLPVVLLSSQSARD